MILDLIIEKQTLWDYLKQTTKPIAIYGMGDGADKIMRVFAQHGIQTSAVFASDAFVRGHSFAGFPVLKKSELEAIYDDFIIIMAFASQRKEVLEQIVALSNEYELYAPDTAVVGGVLFDLDFVKTHEEELDKAYSLLADEQSKKAFLQTINFKISGKIDYLFDIETTKEEGYSLLNLGSDEIFLDLGAYNGDTIQEFLAQTQNQYQKIIAVEPNAKTARKLQRTIDQLALDNVEVHNIGIYSHKDTLSFAKASGRGSNLVENGTVSVPVSSIDSILNGQPVSYIKFDVEGVERLALKGGTDTIQTYRPKLLVSAYHRSEDLFDLILYIHELNPNYKFYFRHHPYLPAWDNNLFCIDPTTAS